MIGMELIEFSRTKGMSERQD